ncbi:tRNA threonylcarbamoyladenosine dehydratase [Anaerosalibacter sp. Marseille-P3206]|uniref:tRNA threonylcarbamoyladenosine dehydratase n=1 Tax=Anaerosalibacter sp. Marseille-P3206 TaxID=1871005 RepID=UPI000BE7C40D|nr:tRNA threonylcarbamoyladenosine dehydratase [Anaerosalibacter sp. Marseille-P3206]
MGKQFDRTELLLGIDAMDKLKDSTVCIFGIGGVGSFVAEGLVRSGIGHIVLVDYDIIDITNINRQIHANFNTVGRQKTEVMKERILSINPKISVDIFNICLNKSNIDELVNKEYSYVVDAIDMVTSKLELIQKCKSLNIPIISSMGTGNKLSPTMLKVGDIFDTKVCPLAKVMRRELRKRGIKNLKVVWSEEEPIKTNLVNEVTGKSIPGSISTVPSVAGLIIASEVIKDLII